MKILILILISVSSAFAATDFPYSVKFELGKVDFAPGDNITISAIHGTSHEIQTNGTYLVEGTYTLTSREEALLSLSIAVDGSGITPTDSKQRMKIAKGQGKFNLIITMHEQGYPHISFYPADKGTVFGGIYFGKGMSLLK